MVLSIAKSYVLKDMEVTRFIVKFVMGVRVYVHYTVFYVTTAILVPIWGMGYVFIRGVLIRQVLTEANTEPKALQGAVSRALGPLYRAYLAG